MTTDTIDAYILDHIDAEGDFLAGLRRDAHVKLLYGRMQSGHLQGRLLKMLCRLTNPRRILEIGTFTGYATLSMAEGLTGDALIHTIEINDEMEPFLTPYLERSPYKEFVRVHWGDARTIVPQLNEVFDLVFIDGDKREYAAYYEMVFPYVRQGGLILADNTLWDGKVATDARPADRQTQGIQAFNDRIKNDPRVEKVILPLRDGLTMIYKKQ